MFRPFAALGSCFVLGILLQNIISLPFSLLFAVSVILLSLSIYQLIKSNLSISFSLLALVFIPLGAVQLSNFTDIVHHEDISNLFKKGNPDISRRMELRLRTISPAKQYTDYYSMITEVENIIQDSSEFSVRGLIAVRIRKQADNVTENIPEPGDLFRVISRIKPLKEYRNYQTGNYRSFYKRKGIEYSVSINSPAAIDLLEEGSDLNIIRLPARIRNMMDRKIDIHFDDDRTAAVFKAMTLGIKPDSFEEVRYTLRMSGIYHITAISGLHVGILLASILVFLHYAVESFRKKYLYAIFFLFFYTLIVGCSPAVIRASTMAGLYLICMLISRKTDFLNIIAFTAFIMLLVDPRELFSPGFQLTFIITIFIFLALISVASYMPTSRVKRRFLAATIVSTAAFAASSPLIAYHFNTISPVAIPLNILVFPLLVLILNGAVIFFLFVLIDLPLAEVIADILSFLLEIMLDVAEFSLQLLRGSFRIPTPSLFMVMLAFSSLGILLYSLYRKRFRIVSSLVFLLIFLALTACPFSYSPPEKLTIHFLDVGHGDSFLIETPEGKTILIDGGGFYNMNEYIGERVVSKFLWQRGIKTIDLAILTHAHLDHAGGIWVAARNFEIKEFWENGLTPPMVPVYERIEAFIPVEKRRVVSEGYIRKFGKLEITCLSPPSETMMSASIRNEDSLVLMLQYGNARILLTGDIGFETETRLLLKYGDFLEADILKLPHHGSSKSNLPEFIFTVSPKAAILSAGRKTFLSKSDHVLPFLRESNIRAYSTDLHGRITLITDGNSWNIETFSGK